MIFNDRADAGRRLAAALARFKGQKPLVLALPRGGVAVGFEIAKALGAPLDVVLVRKIGAPYQPELAVAAVVDGESPELVVNREIVAALGISDDYLEEEKKRELAEIERRRRVYLAGRPRPPIAGATAIIVDDGIATGATVKAAIRAVRRAEPKRIVLAVPVAPPDAIKELREEVDEVVCLETPLEFGAIGFFYFDFSQLTDADVTAFLDKAKGFGAPPPAAA